MISWKLGPIDEYIPDIKNLFSKAKDHRHADNYEKWPLFSETKFARMGWDGDLVYYSAGIARAAYGENSIRIMSRHIRDREYDFGGYKADLRRGLETLEQSTEYAVNLGYTDIWLSREESPELFRYFAKNSDYNWEISYEKIPNIDMQQWVMRKY